MFEDIQWHIQISCENSNVGVSLFIWFSVIELTDRRSLLAIKDILRDCRTECMGLKRYILSTAIALVIAGYSLSDGYALGHEGCGNVDLRNLVPPIRDQGSTGWCYAFTMADLLSQATKSSVSGEAIALDHIKNGYSGLYTTGSTLGDSWPLLPPISIFFRLFGTDFKFGSGDLKGAFEVVKKTGLCNQEKFRNSDLNAFNTFEAIYQLKLEANDAYSRSTHFLKSPRKKQRAIEKIRNIPCIEATVQNVFPEIKINKIVDVLFESEKENVVSEMAKAACGTKSPLGDLKIKSASASEDGVQAIENLVATALDSEQIVGLEYNPDFMRKSAREIPANTADPEKAPLQLPPITGHASSVVGRRWNSEKNRCELLIRDSHGPKCILNGKFLLKDGYSCEGGYIWVGVSELNSNTYKAVVVR